MSEFFKKLPKQAHWVLALLAAVVVVPIIYNAGVIFGEYLASSDNAADAAALEQGSE